MIRNILDPNFYRHRKNYYFQCLCAGLSVVCALLLFNVVHQPVIIASFGASAFLAFSFPHRKRSSPRCLIGGYFIGVLTGACLHYLTLLPISGHLPLKMLYVLAGGSAVALSMLIMSIFNAEHPPASSIALGFVINDWDPHTVLLVLAGISLISLIKQLLKDRIIDLYTD